VVSPSVSQSLDSFLDRGSRDNVTAYLTCKKQKTTQKTEWFLCCSYRLKIADKIENHSEHAEEHKTAHNTGHDSDNELIFVGS
jgi:hypothetical protein